MILKKYADGNIVKIWNNLDEKIISAHMYGFRKTKLRNCTRMRHSRECLSLCDCMRRAKPPRGGPYRRACLLMLWRKAACARYVTLRYVTAWLCEASLLSASLYVSKRGAYWDRLCRDVVGSWLVGRWLVGWLSRACTVAKRCILGLYLLWNTNRKPYPRNSMVQLSTPWGDP